MVRSSSDPDTTSPAGSGEALDPPAGPTSQDYDGRYYQQGLGPPYVETEPHWTTFFSQVADGIIRQLSPRTVLDAGCATGFLVAALARCGVEAAGIDVSEFAVEQAVTGARGRLRVASLTEPIDGQWDLITCIEVLEHMPASEIHLALDNICRSTDRILLSSTPHDFAEATHVSVKPVPTWVAWFAERGFFRRTDLDLSYISPWAMVLERGRPSVIQLAYAYETELQPLREELVSKRAELLSVNRRLGELETRIKESGSVLPDSDPRLVGADRVLSLVDQVIALQAELAEERYQHDRVLRGVVQGALREAEDRAEGAEQYVNRLLSSRSWRLGQALARPARRLRETLRRPSD